MALTTCKECGKEISEHATVCPHCGYPLAKEEPIVQNLTKENSGDGVIADSTKPRHSKIIPIVIVSAIVVIAAIIAVILIKNAQEKAKSESIAASEAAAESSRLEEERINTYNEYVTNLEAARFAMLNGAAKSEEVCNLTKAVWYNTIYEKSDSKTDKYTKTAFGFNSDFNTSLEKLYASDEIALAISELKANQKVVEDLIKSLQLPTDEFSECYKTVMEMYGAYSSFVQLAISPSGSLQTYSENFATYDNNLMTIYDKLGVQIPPKQ